MLKYLGRRCPSRIAAVLWLGGVVLGMASGGWLGPEFLRLSLTRDLDLPFLEAWVWELVLEERIGDDWFMGVVSGLLMGLVVLGEAVWRFAGGVG